MTLYSDVKARSLRPVPRVAAAWSISVMSLMLLVVGETPALDREPPNDSDEQGTTHMRQMDLAMPNDGSADKITQAFLKGDYGLEGINVKDE